MLKGTAFSNIGTFLIYYNIITAAGVFQSRAFKIDKYYTNRISWAFSDLTDKLGFNNFISLQLQHSWADEDGSPLAWENVSASDIIGPVDDDGNPYPITDGVYKRLVWTLNYPEYELWELLGERIYSVTYIGEREWLRSKMYETGTIVGGKNFKVFAFVTYSNIHAGIATKRYPFEGKNEYYAREASF